LPGTIVNGGAYPNFTVNQSSGNIGPFPMGSFTGTGDGIYLDSNVSMFNFEFANIAIQGMGGVGIREAALGNAFTVQYNNISCGLNGGHQFDIFGGNTVSLRNCYAGFVPTPECAGYRIRTGATLYTCNGTNGGDYWLVMGNAGPYTFTPTGGSTTTAVYAGQTWASNLFLGQTITDTTTGGTSIVTGNTATTITFSPAMSSPVASGNSVTLGGEIGGAQNSPIALIGCNLESFNLGAIRSRNSGPVVINCSVLPSFTQPYYVLSYDSQPNNPYGAQWLNNRIFGGGSPLNGYIFHSRVSPPLLLYSGDNNSSYTYWDDQNLIPENSSGLATASLGYGINGLYTGYLGVNTLYIGSYPWTSIITGTGAPTAAAPQGSLYLRQDGSSSSTRAYIATSSAGGAGSWTNLVTAG